MLFFFLTYGEVSAYTFIPLGLLILQFILVAKKTRSYLVLLLLNPVCVCAIYYTIKPITNYTIGKPTIMKCTYYLKGAPKFDLKESVHLDYYDDDCDCSGLYYYTLDINNFMTRGLIKLLGNPLETSKK